MLALRKLSAAPGAHLQEVPQPCAPGPGDVLVEVAAAGICGSDLHLFEWRDGFAHLAKHLPVTLGHEFAGRVAAIGAGACEVQVGDLVAVMPGVSCYRCAACTSGRPAACSNRRALGVTLDGGFARQVTVPAANCIPLPAGTDPLLAALLEPLAIGDNAASIAGVEFGDIVVVLGPGTIGQAVCRSARWRGAHAVVAVGFHDEQRLATALAVGATHAIDLAHEPSLRNALVRLTGAEAADKVVEATGNAASLADGISILRHEGTYVSAGIHAQHAPLDLEAVVRRRLTIKGSYSSHRRSWEALAQRIADTPEAVRPMVSRSMPLAEALEGFELCRTRQVSKVMLLPQ